MLDNILEEIGGLKGERLAVRLLKRFIVQSRSFQAAVLSLLCEKLKLADEITCRDGLRCYCEYQTQDDDGKGFIDMVIEADNAVIGIEAKFWAELRAEQLGKYRSTLEEIGGKRSSYFLILAPENRKDEIEGIIADKGADAKFLSWKELIERVESDIDELPQLEKLLFDHWKYYCVKGEGPLLEYLPRLRDALRTSWDDSGRELCKKCMDAIWWMLPDGKAHWAGGKNYVGYSCRLETSNPNDWFWIGCVRNDLIEVKGIGASLVVQLSDKEIDFSPGRDFEEINIKGWPGQMWCLKKDREKEDGSEWRELLGNLFRGGCQ